MNRQEDLVEIRLLHVPKVLEVIKILRSTTTYSMAEIKMAASEKGTLTLGRLHRLDHQEILSCIETTLDALASLGVDYELIFNGQIESREVFDNLMASADQIIEDIQVYDDLHLGEPDIETLEKMKERWPTQVFRETLRQIHLGEGYNINQETQEWVAAELEKLDES